MVRVKVRLLEARRDLLYLSWRLRADAALREKCDIRLVLASNCQRMTCTGVEVILSRSLFGLVANQ